MVLRMKLEDPLHTTDLASFSLLHFHSVTLIVLSSEEGTSELKLERLLQMVFGAMVRLLPIPKLQPAPPLA